MADIERPHLVYGPIGISFEAVSEERDREMEREYQQLSEMDSDPIGQWLRLEKAKGEFEDTDEVLLSLIVELHRKVDRLEKFVRGEERELIPLDSREKIEFVGFNSFELQKDIFIEGKNYYGRIEMETYPERDVPIFFQALNGKLAEIKKIHNRDDRDWSSYVRARERVMIREQRGAKKW